MSDWDEDPDDEGRAPICPACGVTALPSERSEAFVCENPDCESFGDPVTS